MPLLLLIDEDISPTVAYRLMELGFDAVPVRDRGLLGAKDWDLWRWCLKNERAIYTVNREEFERHHERWLRHPEGHCGIITAGDWGTEKVFEAILAYLQADPPDSLRNRLIVLPGTA